MRSRYLAAFVLILSVVSPSWAMTTLLWDNGTPNGTSGLDATLLVQAEDFTLTQNATIDHAGIFVGDLSPAIDHWDAHSNHLEYFFFADRGDGLAPANGAPLVTGLASNLTITDTGTPWGFGGNAFLAEFDMPTPFNAIAGTTYWFGVHLKADFDPTNGNRVFWATSNANGTAASNSSANGTFDNWNPVSFTNDDQLAGFFSTQQQQAVPEPISATLGLMGLATLGIATRRRVA